jgi:PAS domain S-box-containing protein
MEKRPKILVVEDERIVAADIEHNLIRIGYDVAGIVSSGEAVLNKLKNSQVDLVIMDIVLKGKMNGIDTAEEIRINYDIPVIYLTAYADIKTLEKAKKTEPYGYILKPFEDIDLKSTIEMALYKHEMQKKLKASEEQYRALTENTNDIVYSIDINRLVTYIGPQISHYGLDQNNIISKKISDLAIPEDKKTVAIHFKKRSSTGEEFPIEFRIKDQRGSIVWIEEHGKVQYNKSGTISGVTGILRDITRRKWAEEQLRKLSQAVEQSPASVVITDTKGCIEYVNPKFTQTTGYAFDEVVKKNNRLLKSGEKIPEDYEKLWADITRGEIWRGEFHNRKKNGELFWENVTIGPIKNENGEITHFIAVKEDITELKRLEDQLRHAQKMEAIGTLVGAIAHDFNNILTPIFGFINIALLNLEQENNIRDGLEHALRAADRAKGLVQQILTFSREVEPERNPIQIHDIVKEVLNQLRVTLPKSIKIKKNIDLKCGSVLANPTQIHQILMNLCTNASHAMGENDGILEVKLLKIEANSKIAKTLIKSRNTDFIHLSVHDSGHGMDSETKKRIFDPFFTTKGVNSGTGLGLSIVHSIIKNYGGQIIVDSKLGKGTTVNIFLPCADRIVEKKVQKVEKIPKGKREHILFIDDEEEIALMGKLMLEQLDYTITMITSGKEALKLFRKKPDTFNLVITDYIMPEMTGSQLAGNLLRIRSDIPIILCTGFSEAITSEKAKSLGIREFLMKPLTISATANAIRNVLDN